MNTKEHPYSLVFFCILFLMISACGYTTIKHGVSISDDRVARKIVDGKTTKQDVLLEFGAPTKTVNNEKMFFYEWTEESEMKIPLYKGTTTYINQLSIIFDEMDVVKNHRISEISAGSQRSIGETKTP
jgi:outer membrane protein assembly factor BamE (lipoprotein component of BamABCDE complex)